MSTLSVPDTTFTCSQVHDAVKSQTCPRYSSEGKLQCYEDNNKQLTVCQSLFAEDEKTTCFNMKDQAYNKCYSLRDENGQPTSEFGECVAFASTSYSKCIDAMPRQFRADCNSKNENSVLACSDASDAIM